jgi:hypothetical protein
MIDAHARIIAAYPFAMVTATPDQAVSGQNADPMTALSGFHLTLPYVDGVSALRVRRGNTILGSQYATAFTPIVNAPQVRSGELSWSGAAGTHYLVRASIDNGRTWEVIGIDLNQPVINLAATRISGQRVQFEITASSGLDSETVKLGPVFVPEK